MKYIRQFLIILFISAIGEMLHTILPLPIPASVYGLVLMLTALVTGIIKLTQVRETSKFLIEIMPVMFIPAGVGLLDSWGALKPVIVPVMVITVLTTIIVMAVTGHITQLIIRRQQKRRTKE